MLDGIKPCRCGGKARIRRKKGALWLQCKRCKQTTGLYIDIQNNVIDTRAEERAILEWNKMAGTDTHS